MAPNRNLISRLEGIFLQLMGAYHGGRGMASANKGNEREILISQLLSQVFPVHYRFSSGEVVDSKNNNSGQLDVVVEQPTGFSFPLHAHGPRLFLADSVAAAIEVKSNLSNQWDEVLRTGNQLRRVIRGPDPSAPDKIERVLARMNESAKEEKGSSYPSLSIPLFVVGFEGWKSPEVAKRKVEECGVVDGLFVLDSKIFVKGKAVYSGESSLIAFLESLEQEVLRRFEVRIMASWGYFK